MLSNNDWQHKHDQFLSTSQALLYKSEECLSHLELRSPTTRTPPAAF